APSPFSQWLRLRLASAMAPIRHVTPLPDFRVFRKLLRVYFFSSMAPSQHPHVSADNLQTRSPRGGASRSVWQIGARVALFGMIVNLIFAMAKILGGFFGHAYALIADGSASALDVGGSFVIWGGLKVASRPPDATHPYGHGKAEPIAAVI